MVSRDMVRIQVSEHRMVMIHRRSLCDNCSRRDCTSFNGSRVTECPNFKPHFVIFMKCRNCGAIYDPYYNIAALDSELCPECNEAKKNEGMVVVCHR
ncbi:MAG: hypothetical protein JXA45_00880 [Methanomassiliicoccales archaeon]|nr:hypothetical protein [Methanomassiliicoccales archaeon]